jgi:hypothetical protein
MTRTEERLTDALTVRAASVSQDILRPLPAAAARRPAWLRRYAPLASAAAVLAILAGVLVAGHVVGTAPGRPFVDAARLGSPPPYFVDIEGDNNNIVTVRRTANDRVTDRLTPPPGWHLSPEQALAVQGFEPSALASAADRLFVVSYNNASRRTGLFLFTLTISGTITDVRSVPGGSLPGLVNIALAFSPDLSRLAISGIPAPRTPGNYSARSARIIVISLRTGTRSVFKGGMTRSGRQFSIPNLTWSAGGRSLYYVAQWCVPELDDIGGNIDCTNGLTVVPPGRPVSLVRELRVTGHGGRLTAGLVVLRGTAQYPRILQVTGTPGGKLLILVHRGARPFILRLDPESAQPPAVVYDKPFLTGIMINTGYSYASLAADGSGHYIIAEIGGVGGWVHQDTFHWLLQGTQSLTW